MGDRERQKQADVWAWREWMGEKDGYERILVEPSPVVRRSVVGGVVCVNVVWLVWSG